MKVKLYKTINGERRLVDFGTINHVETYYAMGYEVVPCPNDNQRLWRVVKSEFDAIWNTLPAREQKRLADLNSTGYGEETIEEKLTMLKAETVRLRKPVVRRPRKLTWRDRMVNFINTLIPMEVNYAVA